MTTRYVTYLRVSTDQQGRSGLGMKPSAPPSSGTPPLQWPTFAPPHTPRDCAVINS